ncbi:MAG: hypothetical protein C0425_06275 [Chlorobiaceae bacterium]|nr:hypothetical protein [Chlorobiaceae bacterium]MBA4309926.1 hypothetical protein [Chlorobiaceae bacterium]
MNLSNAENILIVRLSSLGDVLLSTPLIRGIKNKYNSLNIDIITRNQFGDVYRHNPYIRNLYTLEENNFDELNKSISKNSYDFILDLQNNLRSRKITSQFNTQISRFKKKTFAKFLLVNFKINFLKNLLQLPIRYAETVSENGKKFLDEKGLELFLPNEIKPSITKMKSTIGFIPGSQHFTKRWQKENFIKLGNMLINQGKEVLLFGGKADNQLCDELSNEIKDAKNLCTDDNLFQLAMDMTMCDAIVSNDSGLMHLASTQNVPLVVLFGSSVAEFGFTPYKTKNIIVENKNLSCRPCSHIGKNSCPKEHFNCMKTLTPEIVHEKLKTILSQ